MQERATCNSGLGKPSKYEQVSDHKWSLNNTYSDSDKKRTTMCKNLKLKRN